MEARKRFEESVHTDRLVNPSAANPGMAAGRPGGGRRDRPNRPGTRLRPPPMALELPLLDLTLPPSAFERGGGATGTVLLMPVQHCVNEEMRGWAQREGLFAEELRLPALMKPYLNLPLDRLTIRVRRHAACLGAPVPQHWQRLANGEHWHSTQ